MKIVSIVFFFVAFIVAYILTKAWIPLVERWGAVDAPDESRRIHTKVVPLLGGVPLLVSIAAAVSIFLLGYARGWFGAGMLLKVPFSVFAYLGVSALIIIVGGFFDDRYRLPWYVTIWFPLVAVVVAILGGVQITHTTNPLGGILNLQQSSWAVGAVTLWWPAHLITFVWLLCMSYTMKILDGLDGLAAGVGGIGALVIAGLALLTRFFQPDIATLALILAGACAGFLLFNFFPAKIFLGEGGSVLIGFLLGVLAILSGSKIMTTLLVVAVPLMDVAWTIIRRLAAHRAITLGDRAHLHHRLLDIGFSHRGTVLFLYAVSVIFGVSGLFLENIQKVFLLGALVVFVLALIFIIQRASHYVFSHKK